MAKLKLKKHHINRDWCKGCSICVELCPKNVLELDDQEKVSALRTQDCICCRLADFVSYVARILQSRLKPKNRHLI